MNATSWHATVNSRRFALAELCIVAICGAALCLVPGFGIWAVAVSLIPWGFRFAVGEPLFRRTRVDLLLAIFVLTAFAGFWASYDKYTALQKLNLLLMAAVFYYALRSQPRENLIWISAGFFSVGVGVAVYFFLTHDFVAVPRKIEVVNVIGRAIMWLRPEFGLRAIHPNYVAGFAAVMAPFGFYLLLARENKIFRSPRITRLIVAGFFLIFSAIVMTTSRGAVMAIVAAIGVGLLWLIVTPIGNRLKLGKEAVFPSLVFIYLAAVILVLYAGPAQSPGNIEDAGDYGDGSRWELFSRSVYLLADFPITGGGLASFPGLYSQYILNIPYYQLHNSHNLFLDVFIEQGLFGGSAFLVLYVAAIWRVTRNIASPKSSGDTFMNWIVLGSLVIAALHGFVDDYLYYQNGALFSLALLGIVPNSSGTRPMIQRANRFSRADIIVYGSVGAVLAALIFIYQGTLKSIWYSNLGAVQMAWVELDGFPANQWADPSIVGLLRDSETSLRISVEADPNNRTANHRLGLIAMLRRDFVPATKFLKTAYIQSPRHRGIVKSLGFSYTWSGNRGLAHGLLATIPEAVYELDTYVWYWSTQGLPELSSYAVNMRETLNTLTVKP